MRSNEFIIDYDNRRKVGERIKARGLVASKTTGTHVGLRVEDKYGTFKGSARVSLLAPKAKCLSVSASLSQLSTLLCLLLPALPRLFPVDVTLSAAFCLRGLSLYTDALIPEGDHRLLDVSSSVEGSTQCNLDESKLRAFLVRRALRALKAMVRIQALVLGETGEEAGSSDIKVHAGLGSSSGQSKS
ncbi:hypothetical protein JHK84_053399 [Glycine max]|nr:hypothetical protein JHK86_053379 [Glycine max]KAG5083361.1 hypothetical protein JHK84_053399 [Glycine max]